MADTAKLIVDVLQAADGEIIGRIRMQKIVYLLQELGVGSQLPFSYHHYGPYSEELSRGLMEAELVDRSIDEAIQPFSSGGSLSIYTLSNKTNRTKDHVGNLPMGRAAQFIGAMKRQSSVVLELAATIHWIQTKEKVADWKGELRLRKPSKASDANVSAAEVLLRELNLSK